MGSEIRADGKRKIERVHTAYSALASLRLLVGFCFDGLLGGKQDRESE